MSDSLENRGKFSPSIYLQTCHAFSDGYVHSKSHQPMKQQNPQHSQYAKITFAVKQQYYSYVLGAHVLGLWSTIISKTEGKQRVTKSKAPVSNSQMNVSLSLCFKTSLCAKLSYKNEFDWQEKQENTKHILVQVLMFKYGCLLTLFEVAEFVLQ